MCELDGTFFPSAGLCQIQSFFRRNALYRGGLTQSGRGVSTLESFAAYAVRLRTVRLLVTEPLRATSALFPQPPASTLRAAERIQRK